MDPDLNVLSANNLATPECWLLVVVLHLGAKRSLCLNVGY